MTTLVMCWSGDRSRALADIMAGRLPRIVGNLDCLVSPQMEPGRVWSQHHQQRFDAAESGLLCLTPEAVGSAWMHYEAGMLAARIGGPSRTARVFTYLLGLDALSGPLGAYEQASADVEGTEQLVDSLLQVTGGQRLQEYSTWWIDVRSEVRGIAPVRLAEVVPQLDVLLRELAVQGPMRDAARDQVLDRHGASRAAVRRLREERPRVRSACRPADIAFYDDLLGRFEAYAAALRACIIDGSRHGAQDAPGSPRDAPPALQHAERRRRELAACLKQLGPVGGAPVTEGAIRVDVADAVAPCEDLTHRAVEDREAGREPTRQRVAPVQTPDGAGLLRFGPAEWNARRQPGVVDLSHLQIRNADLRDSDLRDVDFDGTEFVNVNLSGADLGGARLNGVVMKDVSLEGATLAGAECKGTDFERVCLRGARLDGLEAFEVKLRRSDLTAATLRGAHLRSSHIYNCDMTDAECLRLDAEEVTLKRVVGSGALLDGLRAVGARVELPNQPRPEDLVDWATARLPDRRRGPAYVVRDGRTQWFTVDRWDFFISHATVDKEAFARPLSRALEGMGQRVWLDVGEVKANDTLETVIAYGVGAANFGVAILSPRFLGREWTDLELDLLEGDRLFVVLHDGFTLEELHALRPGLRSKVTLTSDGGPVAVARQLMDAVSRPPGEIS